MRTGSKSFFIILCMWLCAGSSKAGEHVVRMQDKAPYFQPAYLEVGVGETVTWKNSGPEMVHIIVTEDSSLFSDDVSVDKSWSYTFKKAGTYSYICFRHFFMRGTVVVRNPDG